MRPTVLQPCLSPLRITALASFSRSSSSHFSMSSFVQVCIRDFLSRQAFDLIADLLRLCSRSTDTDGSFSDYLIWFQIYWSLFLLRFVLLRIFYSVLYRVSFSRVCHLVWFCGITFPRAASCSFLSYLQCLTLIFWYSLRSVWQKIN